MTVEYTHKLVGRKCWNHVQSITLESGEDLILRGYDAEPDKFYYHIVRSSIDTITLLVENIFHLTITP